MMCPICFSVFSFKIFVKGEWFCMDRHPSFHWHISIFFSCAFGRSIWCVDTSNFFWNHTLEIYLIWLLWLSSAARPPKCTWVGHANCFGHLKFPVVWYLRLISDKNIFSCMGMFVKSLYLFFFSGWPCRSFAEKIALNTCEKVSISKRNVVLFIGKRLNTFVSTQPHVTNGTRTRRGGSCRRYITKPFASIKFACAMRLSGLCMGALCELVAPLLPKNVTCVRPRCNATTRDSPPARWGLLDF